MRPKFPLKGGDLVKLGMKPGPEISEKLSDLERYWVENNFSTSREELLEQIGVA